VGSWGFIGLAYGAAAVTLGVYVLALRGRLRDASQALTVLEVDGGRKTR